MTEDVQKDLLAILERIVAAWESISENDQVNEEMNDDEIWEEARAVISIAKAQGAHFR